MRRRRSRCRHPETIEVRSTGMVRIVCEGCGHVSFAFDTDRREPTQAPVALDLEVAVSVTVDG